MWVDRKFFKKLDYTLLAAVALLITYSLLIISSAGHVKSTSFSYVERQMVWLVLGVIVMVALMSIDYKKIAKFMWYLYALNFLMLAAVIVTGFSTLGAQRWIQIGPVQIQPSEFSKLLIIITFASFLVNRNNRLSRFRDLLPCFIFMGVPVLLILKQPDLGTSLVFVAIMFGMLYIAGARPALLVAIILAALVLVTGWLVAHYYFDIWIPLKDYQFNRLVTFLDPWKYWNEDGYQVIQSQIAIGSGGFWGKGLYQGTQSQLNFLPGPEQHTDFIFSVVGEEIGFKGAVALLALYLIILFRGLCIAAEARDKLGTLLAVGVVSMFAFQVAVNIGMTVGIMPVTGLPLPLFSYGGSSLLANMAALGVLLNVYMRRQKIIF